MVNLSWGKAKQEVIANSKIICDRYNNGETVSAIYKYLFDQNMITCKDRAFRGHAAKLVNRACPNKFISVESKSTPSLPASSTPPPPKPASRLQKPRSKVYEISPDESFGHDPRPTEEHSSKTWEEPTKQTNSEDKERLL